MGPAICKRGVPDDAGRSSAVRGVARRQVKWKVVGYVLYVLVRGENLPKNSSSLFKLLCSVHLSTPNQVHWEKSCCGQLGLTKNLEIYI